jgi:DNA sulfur modification protein DndC
LLDIERQFRGMSRRAGVFDALEERLRAGQYADEEEAIRIRTEQEQRKAEAMQETEHASYNNQYESDA